MKKKQNHRHREQISGCKWEEDVGLGVGGWG